MASALSSRNVVPGSMMAWIRSRGSIFPRLRCKDSYLPPPPAETTAKRSRNTSTRFILTSWRIWNVLSAGFTLDLSTGEFVSSAGGSRSLFQAPVLWPLEAAPFPKLLIATASPKEPELSSSAAASPVTSRETRAVSSMTLTPASTRTSRTMPGAGATMSLIIFMALMTTSTSPASTVSPTCTLTSASWPGNGAWIFAISPAAVPFFLAFPSRASLLASMKFVYNWCSLNRGCSKMPSSSFLFVFGPSMTKSASCCKASTRQDSQSPAEWTINFANKGSYSIDTVDPSTMPESTRTPAPSGAL
mmetsp:Transcript_112526/g.317815  ORF Transcript_112526/g.317815 Transcript_112526/m.317815 type:complete len:303 (-) Transcript_112526:787-1695(-)